VFTPLHRGGSGPPLLCIHGFLDTWRTWELVLPALERRHEVLAPTLPGHAGGPPLDRAAAGTQLVDALERALDAAGLESAHVVGSSLGGYLALRLAARGRACSVVALAPAGGWAPGSGGAEETLAHFASLNELLVAAAPFADDIVSTPEGRRQVTQFITTDYEHIPAELLSHLLRGAALCEVDSLLGYARTEGWTLDAGRIDCPIRILWGTDDQVLPWPAAAARYREEWLPNADWVELDDVGHCPQLDVPSVVAELIVDFTSR
jgi:pimeloyl-ACP methyl ester carboxylesterase